MRSHPAVPDGRLVLPWYRRELYDERPMLLVVGRRGTGKTLFAVRQAVERMRQGYPVYANFEILDPFTGLQAGRVYAWEQVYDLDGATVVIDEANNWIPSRKWDSTPMEVLSKFAMSRKEIVEFIFTAQHEERVDKVVRELVDWIVICRRAVPFVRRLPLYRYIWTYLESIEQDRLNPENRSSDCKIRTGWVPAHVFYSYGTQETVALGYGANRVPDRDRREPVILYADGSHSEWDSSEAIYRGSWASLPHAGRLLHFGRHAREFSVPAVDDLVREMQELDGLAAAELELVEDVAG